ncbi:MAG: class II aldolase/adducin family protein [Anaerolineae bacterium]|nr:class II aldolase/adducin family protein [Anaerolineae bacterium]
MTSYASYKQQVVDICRQLVEKGFLAGTGGNVSVRIPAEKAFAVTPSNYDYMKMNPDDICILALDTRVIEGNLKPSIESSLHAAIYETRPDANVVIHTHQIYASAFALINQPIPALFDEQARFLGRSVEIVSYAPSGTAFLKKNIVAKLRNHCNAYILQNHGAVCLADTAERAIFNVQLLEKCALTYLLALCTDKKVSRIPLVVREIAVSKLRKDQEKAASPK